uniref:Dysbindin n=1 Tax=Neogobius melanostomus TaxID=47308 RepID=A0A8C6WTR5_9GOBI
MNGRELVLTRCGAKVGHSMAGQQNSFGGSVTAPVFTRSSAVCRPQLVDGDIVMLSALWDKRRSALTQLEEQLQGLPALVRELDTITTGLAELEGDFEEMESRLVYLETLCCRCEQQTVKQQHLKELEAHRKKKRYRHSLFKHTLNAEHAQKVSHMEQLVQQKLKAKQKEYEQAFHQDVEKYLSSGFLTHKGESFSASIISDISWRQDV